MRNLRTQSKNKRAAPLLEWQTYDSDAEWQAASPQPLTNPEHPPHQEALREWIARYWPIGAALLLLLAIGAFWTWRVAQRGVDEIESELHNRVELDLWTVAAQAKPSQAVAAEGESAQPLTSSVQVLALPGDKAIVEVVTQASPNQVALRQTRFYKQSPQGWQPVAAEAQLWGSPDRLEIEHFTLRFRQRDAEVVNAIAPQLDELYRQLQHNFGVSPDPSKLPVAVSVEQATGAMVTPQWPAAALVVPSPAVYLAPVDLTNEALLAQSIALPLIEYMSGRTLQENGVPTRWQPLLRGVRLWQLWDLDLPLARWQADLVKWLYVDAPQAARAHQPMLAARYAELCAMHRLWVLSPELIGIPLKCTGMDDLSWSSMRWASFVPRTRLATLGVPLANWEVPYYGDPNDPYHSSEAIVFATLIEYTVTVYGDEQLPALLAALARYDDWATLTPAVYGVSAAEFEAGWQRFLAQHYAVVLGE